MLDPNFDVMEPIDSEVEWELDDDLWDIGTGRILNFLLDPEFYLSVYYEKVLIAERQCTGLIHGEWIAEAFERKCERDLARGETWQGKPPLPVPGAAP